jgi:hypothetical protein
MDTKVLTARFFEDPEWKHVEDMLLAKMASLEEITDKDLKEYRGHIEEQIIGRRLAYNVLKEFLQETKLVNKEIKPYKNIFT